MIAKPFDDAVFREAERLTHQGISLHWLKPNSKQPIDKGWSSIPTKTWEQLRHAWRKGYNLGCRTGSYSCFVDGTALIVLDVDIKGGKVYQEEALKVVKHYLGEDLSCYPYATTGRGFHYYARCPIELLPASQKLGYSSQLCTVIIQGKETTRRCWEVELLSTKRQVVLPPSLHPDTQCLYQWINPFTTWQAIPVICPPLLSSSSVTQPEQEMPTKIHHLLAQKPADLEQLAIPTDLKHSIQEGKPKGERSEALFQVTRELLKQGIAEETICTLLTDQRYGLSAKPLEERQGDIHSAAQWVYKYCIVKAKASFLQPEPLRKEWQPPIEPPVDLLPGGLGELIMSVAEAVQVPKAMVLQSVLSSLSLAVQAMANVSIDQREIPLSLFCLTLAESGARKSAVDKIILAPYKAYQKQCIENYHQEKQRYEDELACYHQQRKHVLASKKVQGMANRKAELTRLQVPLAPRYPLFLIEEPSYEGLVKQLDTGYPSLGLFSNEAGRFLGGHAMNAENRLKTIAGLSSLWDGEPITRVRSGDGSRLLYGRRLASHLMAQPVVAQTLLADPLLKEQGFLARYLIAYPENLIGTRLYQEEASLYPRVLQAYQDRITTLLRCPLDLNQETGELSFRYLTLTAEAKAYWIDIYNDIEQKQRLDEKYYSIREFASKAAEHILRIAGCLQLYLDQHGTQIETCTLEAASLIVYYYLDERLRLQNQAEVTPDILLAEKVLTYIQRLPKEKYPNGFSLADIYRNLNTVPNKATAQQAIKILEDHHWVFKASPAYCNGVWRREVWKLNTCA